MTMRSFIMASLYRLFFLTACFSGAVYCSVDLTMTASPPTFEIGLTKDLTITCDARINSSASGMVYLTAILISHDNDALASVSVMSPNGKAIPPFNGTKHASFNLTGDSSITINIKDVDQNDSGIYECEAVGIDFYNLVTRENETLNLTSHTPDNSTYLNEINAIQAQLHNLTDKLEKLGQRWPHVDDDPLFTRFSFPGGKSYLLSKSDLGHVSLSQFICFVQGGYLAEVNDVDEFEFIRAELLREFNETDDVTVWMGTTDAAQEGVWVHQYHPADAVYKAWSANSGYDCMAMTSRTDFHNEDLDCNEKGRALCELNEVV